MHINMPGAVGTCCSYGNVVTGTRRCCLGDDGEAIGRERRLIGKKKTRRPTEPTDHTAANYSVTMSLSGRASRLLGFTLPMTTA